MQCNFPSPAARTPPPAQRTTARKDQWASLPHTGVRGPLSTLGVAHVVETWCAVARGTCPVVHQLSQPGHLSPAFQDERVGSGNSIAFESQTHGEVRTLRVWSAMTSKTRLSRGPHASRSRWLPLELFLSSPLSAAGSGK